jgi:hypothetical protein
VVTTATVEHTTPGNHPAYCDDDLEQLDNDTPTWVWVPRFWRALVVNRALASRHGGGGGGAVSPDERRRRLDGAVASWAAQGWALESQSADSAILQRSGERMLVSVDSAGHVATRPY